MNGDVRGNVVSLGISPKLKVNLDKYVASSLSIPISVFQATSVVEALDTALAYLHQKKEGTLEIPATETEPWVRIVASRDKLGDEHINFITTKHRAPTVENRPYTNEPWEVGDVIISNDIAATHCIGWVCTGGTAPANWMQFGHTKRWYSQLEEVDSLPDPSELQAGRQVILLDPDTDRRDVHYCTTDPVTGEWKWIKMTIFNSDIEKVLRELYEKELKQYAHDEIVNEVVNYFEMYPIDVSSAIVEYFEKNPINVDNEVKIYLASYPLTDTENLTLEASKWSGNSAPFTQVLSSEKFSRAKTGVLSLANCSDEEQRIAASAKMVITSQNGDDVTVSALGTKPSVDLPVSVVLVYERPVIPPDYNIPKEVEEYLSDHPITSEVDLVLKANDWVGTEIPFTQRLSDPTLREAQEGITNLSTSCSVAQVVAAMNARMVLSAQDSESITISAYGTKPTVDIPIKVILFFNRDDE